MSRVATSTEAGQSRVEGFATVTCRSPGPKTRVEQVACHGEAHGSRARAPSRLACASFACMAQLLKPLAAGHKAAAARARAAAGTTLAAKSRGCRGRGYSNERDDREARDEGHHRPLRDSQSGQRLPASRRFLLRRGVAASRRGRSRGPPSPPRLRLRAAAAEDALRVVGLTACLEPHIYKE